MLLIGIDAGNSEMKATYADATGAPQLVRNQRGESHTPSVVYFPASGEPIVGTEALNMAAAEPERVVQNWKRSMGTDEVLYRDEAGVEYGAKDILYILLKDVKANARAQLGEDPTECVITVPANYNDRQKQETREAAERAGMKVIIMPHEPTAAALGNGFHLRSNGRALVYDLGGGTFDVSVVQNRGNVFEILATNGEPHLGGQDFNKRIEENVLEQFEKEHKYRPMPAADPLFFQELRERIESSKISLSVKNEANLVVRCDSRLLNMRITRADVESSTKDLLGITIERSLKTVQDAGITEAEIDEVYPVGGSSLMPMVRQALEKTFGNKVVQKCEPHYAAALGAILAARVEYARCGKQFFVGGVALPHPNILLREVTTYSIGVSVENDNNQVVFYEMIPKRTPIPSTHVKRFKLAKPNQTAALIEVLQGEEGQPRDKAVRLGQFDLTDLPARAEMTERIEIEFTLDSSGVLTAIARDMESGRTAQLAIEYKKNNNDKQGNGK